MPEKKDTNIISSTCTLRTFTLKNGGDSVQPSLVEGREDIQPEWTARCEGLPPKHLHTVSVLLLPRNILELVEPQSPINIRAGASIFMLTDPSQAQKGLAVLAWLGSCVLRQVAPESSRSDLDNLSQMLPHSSTAH